MSSYKKTTDDLSEMTLTKKVRNPCVFFSTLLALSFQATEVSTCVQTDLWKLI